MTASYEGLELFGAQRDNEGAANLVLLVTQAGDVFYPDQDGVLAEVVGTQPDAKDSTNRHWLAEDQTNAAAGDVLQLAWRPTPVTAQQLPGD
jgi:hypothetical protein